MGDDRRSWVPSDPSYTIILRQLKPEHNRGALMRYLRDLFNIGVSEANDYLKGLPDKPIGLTKSCELTCGQAEKYVKPILEKLDQLGLIADWVYDWGDWE